MTLCVFLCISQGWGSEEGKGEGFAQGTTAEEVQPHGGGRWQQWLNTHKPMIRGLDILIHQSLEICQLVKEQTGGTFYTTAAIIQFKYVNRLS